MRLWSIHPCYLDTKGLIALWREALLAQKVLTGTTKGYKNHPQLIRFKNTKNPEETIAVYLWHVYKEATKRGYNFNKLKIVAKKEACPIIVTTGQIKYEYNHLLNKLRKRTPLLYSKLKKNRTIKPHPLFKKRPGTIEKWEIQKKPPTKTVR